jgi:hypothetical protein
MKVRKMNNLLVGPLAHIKYRSAFGFDYYVTDFSRPGAVERFKAEQEDWWANEYWPNKWDY